MVDKEQWDLLPAIMNKVFARFGEIDNWRNWRIDEEQWFACESLMDMYYMMSGVRDLFDYINEEHPMGIVKCGLMKLGIVSKV